MPTKGFFGSLFDMSFSSLVTTKVIKFIYVITLIFLTLLALALVFAGFRSSTGLGVAILLIVAPLVWLFYAGVRARGPGVHHRGVSRDGDQR